MSNTEKILELLGQHNIPIYAMTKAYWELVIDDYIARCTDFEDLELTEQEYKEIIEDVTTDDELWNKIEDTIDYFIRKDSHFGKGENNHD